jgi:hypothetical protein
MQKHILTLLSAAALLLSISSSGLAHEPAGKKTVLVAQVVDTACYLGHNSKDAKHAKCAETCAKEGIPLALLDGKANVLYLPIAMNHKNANPQLMPFIEKQVRVTGTVMEKNGMKGIVIEKVEAVQ